MISFTLKRKNNIRVRMG